MKRIYIWVALLLSLVAAATVYAAAGSVTESIAWIPGQNTKKVIISWVSGTASEGVPDGTISPLNGYLLKAEAHVNGTINPTADYDLTLIEHNNGSLDLFGGMGTNMAVAGETFYPSHNNGSTNIYPVYSATPLTFVHSNSTVNSAAGEVILYVEVPR
jgi:hypothetical protein